eukprot:1187290-Pyramimonas_sp.AAC.1
MGQCVAEVSVRGRLQRRRPEHSRSGHAGTQSCEDVASEEGLNTPAQERPELNDARMSQTKVAE